MYCLKGGDLLICVVGDCVGICLMVDVVDGGVFGCDLDLDIFLFFD